MTAALNERNRIMASDWDACHNSRQISKMQANLRRRDNLMTQQLLIPPQIHPRFHEISVYDGAVPER